MAGFEQEAFNDLRDLLKQTSVEAIPAAERAAAEVFLQAARAAARVVSGQLKRSIAIIEGKNNSLLSVESGNSPTRRIFVGPEKKKGYYGFFVERGHQTAGRNRVERKASGNTHSQRGTTATSTVAAHPWFEPAIRAAEPKAIQAAEAAFETKLQQLNGKK